MAHFAGRFDNKVAFLTGAASGMARSISLRLASEGAKVMGVDVNEAGLAETQKLVTDAGGTMSTRVVDITQRDECHAAINATVEEFGQLDIVGNIAGIAQSKHLTDVTQEDFDRIMNVNVAGTFWCSQAAIPHLLETKGTIVNIASNAGFMGQAYTTPYCASKGAVVNLTRAMAMEYVKTDLRINAVAPGGVWTPLTTSFDLPDDIDFELMKPYMGFREMAQPEEIANVFAFIASDEASNVHGAIWSADNGLTAS